MISLQQRHSVTHTIMSVQLMLGFSIRRWPNVGLSSSTWWNFSAHLYFMCNYITSNYSIEQKYKITHLMDRSSPKGQHLNKIIYTLKVPCIVLTHL